MKKTKTNIQLIKAKLKGKKEIVNDELLRIIIETLGVRLQSAKHYKQELLLLKVLKQTGYYTYEVKI